MGFRPIQKAVKAMSEGSRNVRDFVVSCSIFFAGDYSELNDWSICKITSPLILHGISSERILFLTDSKAPTGFELKTINASKVEFVTEASKKLYDCNNRD